MTPEKMIVLADIFLFIQIDFLSVSCIRDAFYYKKTNRFIRCFKNEFPLVRRVTGLFPINDCAVPFYMKLFVIVRCLFLFLFLVGIAICFVEEITVYRAFFYTKVLLYCCYAFYVISLPKHKNGPKTIDFSRLDRRKDR